MPISSTPSIAAAPGSLLHIRDLTVRFGNAPRPAVDALSLQIAPGESLGLVGESGSGKSVTALAVLRLLSGASASIQGSIRYTAQQGTHEILTMPAEPLRRLRGREIAMIFQEPMTALNPVMPVGRQIGEALLAHQPGMPRRAVADAVHAAMETVALPDPVRRSRDYPHQFSGGQRQRILIAMAIINRPRLLIADEPTTALDVTVQAQILELLAKLREEYGLAMLFISHDLAVVSQVTERVAVMRHGLLLELAPVRTLFQNPTHPYTQALLRAIPTMKTPLDQPLAMVSADAGWREGVLEEQSPAHWVRSF
ncbi:ABC transporter ATP-binding protein [Acidipila sp. EB88]|uniref:ATP-binding cassette domain-containing protein n=1 Tax=Acidipila sp. EB88 TaxID=2305226 RepID=UPI000F5E9E65|nr:ABC transporter ATP-binding protein [Acidipila sp. EB88]RRA48133.1 ABC transporter ATP-binding protein [Acidipila sp. EB88]